MLASSIIECSTIQLRLYQEACITLDITSGEASDLIGKAKEDEEKARTEKKAKKALRKHVKGA